MSNELPFWRRPPRTWLTQALAYLAEQLFLALLALLVAALVPAAWALFSGSLYPLLLVAALAVGFAICFFVLVLPQIRSRQTQWIFRGYRWVRAEFTYSIDETDDRKHIQDIEIEIEAMRPRISSIENRYQWSGSGRSKPILLGNPKHKILGSTIRRGMWEYYYVYLGRELEVGDREIIKIHQEFYDTRRQFQPFLAKTVVELLGNLTLRVKLPTARKAAVKSISLEETSGIAPIQTRVSTKSGSIDSAGIITYSVDSPKFNNNYMIVWSYE